MAKAAKRKSKYSPHPAIRMEAAGKAKILAETGRSFEDWVELARRKGPKRQQELSAWLRTEHGFKSMNAYWLAQTALAKGEEPDYGEPEGLVDALYSGPRAALRPLHERIVDTALACGGDVIATSCKTMVPMYRKHVFAEMRPVEGGVEAQLALGDVPAKGRLQKADGRMPGDRLTHRVLLKSETDVDGEFKGWMAKAYENGAGKMARAASANTPDDLAKALKGNAKAAATWATCTPAMQRDFIQWIEAAKQEETRDRRVERSISNLAAGKKKTY